MENEYLYHKGLSTSTQFTQVRERGEERKRHLHGLVEESARGLEAAVLELLPDDPVGAVRDVVEVDLHEAHGLPEGPEHEGRQPQAALPVAGAEGAEGAVLVPVPHLPLVACETERGDSFCSYFYESEIPFACYVSLMEGKRVLQKFLLEAKPMNPDLGDKMKLLENARIMALSKSNYGSIKCKNYGTEIWKTFERILYDVMPCRRSYKYRVAQTSESISL
ncbi:hypothetical protein AVEN_254928-1 [Araneus ventricosus]|uniref:Uncharacterized protein n=1 Tax=Araneus ventricosus TaxID=182803 RepID=A0A4Y2K4E3_ARAVE|nr:hypothetical protein AVEN_254928-1 [Araneus ventricosus]